MVILHTLRMQRRLIETGMPEEQATLVVEKLSDILAEALAKNPSMIAAISELTDRMDELTPLLKPSDAETP